MVMRASPVILALVAAACAGVAPPPPPAPAPAAPVPLTEREVGIIAQLIRHEDERRLETLAFGTWRADSSVEIRRRAALALGRIGDVGAEPMLLAALADSAPAVRREAAFALGLLGDTTAAVTAALAGALADEPTVAREAAAALGKLRTFASFNALWPLLADPASTTGDVLGAALLAVWHLPQAERALPPLAPLLAHPDSAIRWRATYAVMRIGTPASVAMLLPNVADSVALVRSVAIRGLRRPVADSAGETDAARVALEAALSDPDGHVRISALNAIVTWSDSAFGPAATAGLDDPDGNVRVAAAQALKASGGGRAALALLAVTGDGAAPAGIRAAALDALVAIDPSLAARVASGWLGEPRWLMRYFVVRAFGGQPWGAAGDVLSRAARDPYPLVATNALSALARGRDTPAAARTLFLEGMRREEPEVRAAAIRGLARTAGTSDLGVFLDAYERAAGDSNKVAALAAVDGLGAVRRAGVPAENAFFARFEPPSDPVLLRRIAARLGGSWPVPPVAEPGPRPDAYYIDAVERLVAPLHRGEPAPRLVFRMPEGEIEVEFAPEDSPLTVLNMISLVESGYFDVNGDVDRHRWHRVVPNFVLQDGDTRGDGGGGPGYAIRDEINRIRYDRGVLGMALSGPDTGGSQFFITHSPQPHLDGTYTIFGRVVRGMDVADRVLQDDPILEMRIIHP